MDDGRELHRFSRGEHCSDCKARKWYLENGFRYCQNGHRVQSWVEYDAAEDEVKGRGQVSRRSHGLGSVTDDLNAKQRLTGVAARILFSECLQILLLKQVAWMILVKTHPPELEAVIRDLWDLRLRQLIQDTDPSEQTPPGFLHTTRGGEILHDSLNITTSTGVYRMTGWRGPCPLDTLSICYLGCLLLRLPTTVGDIVEWANKQAMPYKQAVYTPLF